MKWRFVGGSPYTPLDRQKSAQIAAWDARGRAYPDYDRLNSKRLNPFHQLDLRVDKQYFFDNWSLMLYLDVQNVYDFTADEPPVFIRKTNEEGEPLVEPNNPGRYVLKQLELETSGNILPSLGIIVEF